MLFNVAHFNPRQLVFPSVPKHLLGRAAVAVYRGLVWDTNDPFAQDLSLRALDRAVGFCNGDAMFAGYVQQLLIIY